MTTDAGSTVPRRQLGRYLRQLREEARVTVKAAADALEWSTPKIWRIESGIVSMRALDVEAMCRAYGAAPDITQALMGLAKETKAKGWWHSYGDAIPHWFELYVGLESAASRLRIYEPELIPGILQTPEYATRVFRVAQPEMPPVEVERGVAVRIGRQALLRRSLPPPPQLEVVLNEVVLRRSIGCGMAEQLHHLCAVGDLPNVSIRVLPIDAGLHRAAMVGGPFIILDFPASGEGRQPEPSTVYSDGLTGALYLDKPAEVAAFNSVWESTVTASLDEQASADLIAEIARGYRSD